jgi:hypothetical protein
MTHVKSGMYRIDGGLFAGSQQVRLQVTDDNIVVTTDDGRTAQYHRSARRE